MTCTCKAPKGLTRRQKLAVRSIRTAWDGVVSYRVGEESVLVVGHQGSEYHFSLVSDDGRRQRISDPLNQSHWLEGITSGQYPVVR